MASAAKTEVLTADFDCCDLHIRTLSTILHNMSQGSLLTSTWENVPAFLRYIAIILTRGINDSDEQAVAVAATIEESSLSMLVVAQDSLNARPNGSESFNIETTFVKRSSETLEEIYQRYQFIVY